MRYILSSLLLILVWLFSPEAFDISHTKFCSALAAQVEEAPTPALPLHAPQNDTEDNDIDTEHLPFFQRILQRAETAWTDGEFDLYIPLYAWHNRFMYHSGEGSSYNETPWGVGFGKSFYDADGDFHGLFIMGFEDSNNHFQPVMGYTYVKNWLLADDLKFGLGVAAGLSARHELYYIPFPAALPLVGLEYGNLAIQATYIPGQYNHGNVLFTWSRWHFD